MSQLVGELVKSGQRHNLMSTDLLMWESTAIAGIQLDFWMQESGATPLIQISDGSTALFHIVMQYTTVRKAIHWVPAIREG